MREIRLWLNMVYMLLGKSEQLSAGKVLNEDILRFEKMIEDEQKFIEKRLEQLK